MLDAIIWICMAILACVGFVQCATWLAVRHSCKGNHVYRVIPIGGEGKNTGNQMALMYTCLQWEANPSRQDYVLYGIGLDEKEQQACEELARAAGVCFVQTPDELEALLRTP